MPLPKPGAKDDQKKFVDRFMGDAKMVKEYPDEKQRYTVAMSQWKKKLAANAREEFLANHPGHGDQKVHDPHHGGGNSKAIVAEYKGFSLFSETKKSMLSGKDQTWWSIKSPAGEVATIGKDEKEARGRLKLYGDGKKGFGK